jgi:hypothetical protein
MNQKIYEKLVNNLEDILKQYRLLLECVRKEKDLLIQADIENLNANNLLKEQIIARIRGLDALRVTAAQDFALEIGGNANEPRLLDLAQKAGGTYGDKLRTFHSSLALLTSRLVEINKENSVYAESALHTVGSAMDNIRESIMGGQKTYQKKGTYQQSQDKSGHLVSKEA